jgi:hypothetical protein
VLIGIETDRGTWVQALLATGYQVYASTRCRRPVIGNGPLTEATLDQVGVRACAESAELLARKDIGAVREPLNELAKLLNDLRSRALGGVAPMTADDEAACAFQQGRVVQALGAALKSAWVAWEQEWGAV